MTERIRRNAARPSKRYMWALGAAAIVLGAMALDTKIIVIGSQHDVREQRFSAQTFGESEFPKIKENVEKRAVDAVELAKAIQEDKQTAGQKYGVATSTGPVFPVSFTGVVGERKSHYNTVAIEGLPPEINVRVQTGPALTGTDLRDSTGTIQFDQFTNQIEYQDAGSAINNQVKKAVLADIDPNALTGKTIAVVGVFKLVNPKSWIVTPVRLEVQ
ncbi:hypothetical protein ATN84_17515 [Paramesorhizobium deserti]|uniref:DUF2291 domain-containing protein n=1 Tax=Paramesorhizobium deserti TaxID=1494590 RepID=A0A135HRD4_9HYPH|nr:DUF2291 domain-containing protein [Paramesorhizobium deserti]KXF75768.1 hypothetical protein ATN84_17515 [Paramesorhizobium deserti]